MGPHDKCFLVEPSQLESDVSIETMGRSPKLCEGSKQQDFSYMLAKHLLLWVLPSAGRHMLGFGCIFDDEDC